MKAIVAPVGRKNPQEARNFQRSRRSREVDTLSGKSPNFGLNVAAGNR